MPFDNPHLAVAFLPVGAIAGELVHIVVVARVVDVGMEQRFFDDRVAAAFARSLAPLGFVVLREVSRPERGSFGVLAVDPAVEFEGVRGLRHDAVRHDLFHDVLIGPVQTSCAFGSRHVAPVEVAVPVGVA